MGNVVRAARRAFLAVVPSAFVLSACASASFDDRMTEVADACGASRLVTVGPNFAEAVTPELVSARYDCLERGMADDDALAEAPEAKFMTAKLRTQRTLYDGMAAGEFGAYEAGTAYNDFALQADTLRAQEEAARMQAEAAENQALSAALSNAALGMALTRQANRPPAYAYTAPQAPALNSMSCTEMGVFTNCNFR